jgi:hypothetical protein
MRLSKLAAGIAIVAMPMVALAQTGGTLPVNIDHNGDYTGIINGDSSQGVYKITTTAVIPLFVKVTNFKSTIKFGTTNNHELAPEATSGSEYEYATDGWNNGLLAKADKATLRIESNETLIAKFDAGSALKTWDSNGHFYALPTQFAATVTGNLAAIAAGSSYAEHSHQPWTTAILTEFNYASNRGGVRYIAPGTTETIKVHYGNWTEAGTGGGFNFEAALGVKRAGLNDHAGTYTQTKDSHIATDPATITITKYSSGLE